MISGDLGYVEKESFQEIIEEIGDVERMLKATGTPFSQLIGRRTSKFNWMVFLGLAQK